MIELSVVICTYNRDKYLPDALESLKKQDANPGAFEVIVINNNCTDKTAAICEKFAQKHPELNFRHIVETSQGLSFARNRGIQEAKANLIAFIDDDAIAEPDYVSRLLHAFDNYPEFDAVGGKVLPIYPGGQEPEWMSKYIQRLVSKVDDGDSFKEFKKKYPVGCNMAFKKSVFKETGVFNTDLTLRSDDKYIFSKLKKKRKKTIYAPDVVVHHNIEQYRLEHDFIKALSRLNGHTEYLRLKREPKYLLFFKHIDFMLKIIASLLIGVRFVSKGQVLKARYLTMVMWLSWMGFIGVKNTVNG